MESPIFSALPTIHIALLSIMVALYSVFAIYAYQKINEYKQKIDHLISDTKNLIIDIPILSVGLNPPFEKDGAIDWQKSCKLVLQDIRFEFYIFNNPDSFPDKEKTITANTQQSSIDYNVFEGHHVKGLPRYTLSRGQVAVFDGEVRTQEGHGKFVSRAPNAPVNRARSVWKELTNPQPVVRAGIPVTGV